MTTLRLLLSSFLFLGVSQAFSEDTCSKSFDVLERSDEKQYEFVRRELTQFNCQNKFEGQHFKIVKGTDDTAISFDDSNHDLVRKAATVYHHLSKARNFWINTIKSDYVLGLPQLTIRLEITNSYSSSRHFKHKVQEENYNNAWSVPSGETPSFVRDKKTWGKEIWFSPKKVVASRENIESDGNNPVHESLKYIEDPVYNYNKTSLIYQGLSFLKTPGIERSILLDNALPNLTAIAVLYGALYTTKHMDKWFVEKYYFIDTALVPEIIYHEFAHIALSDTMKTVHSVPVIEGLADYFAARIANRDKMYEKMEGISTNKYKDVDNNSFYHPYLEGYWNATSDFTLSLLWLGKKRFEEMNHIRASKSKRPLANYDQLVFNAHFDLNERSNISEDLTKALINSCKRSCNGKRAGVNLLNQVFEQKGLN